MRISPDPADRRFPVVLSHDRRRILHVNVTAHPTAEWTAQQITEAFPGDAAVPRYLRDRDSVYGDAFRRRVVAMGLREVVSARRAPWQNPFAERVIGGIRRDCTDHVVALGEGHLRRVRRASTRSTTTAPAATCRWTGTRRSRARSSAVAARCAPSPTSAGCTTDTRARPDGRTRERLRVPREDSPGGPASPRDVVASLRSIPRALARLRVSA